MRSRLRDCCPPGHLYLHKALASVFIKHVHYVTNSFYTVRYSVRKDFSNSHCRRIKAMFSATDAWRLSLCCSAPFGSTYSGSSFTVCSLVQVVCMTIPKKHCRLHHEAVERCLRFHLGASLNHLNVLRVSCCDFGLVDSLPLLESRDYHIALCVCMCSPYVWGACVDRRSASDRAAPTMNDTTALRMPLACRRIDSYFMTCILASMLADLELHKVTTVFHSREILRLFQFEHFSRSSYFPRWWRESVTGHPRRCPVTPAGVRSHNSINLWSTEIWEWYLHR